MAKRATRFPRPNRTRDDAGGAVLCQLKSVPRRRNDVGGPTLGKSSFTELELIDIGTIDDCAANMRHRRKAPDVGDILPTVRKRGIHVPVMDVRTPLNPVGWPNFVAVVARISGFGNSAAAELGRREDAVCGACHSPPASLPASAYLGQCSA